MEKASFTLASPFSIPNWNQNKDLVVNNLTNRQERYGSRPLYNEAVAVAARRTFSALGALSFWSGVGAAALFGITAVPVAGVAGVAFGFIGLSNVFRVQKEFWNDPVYRAKQGLAIAEDILQNQLSYTQIGAKYGELIRQYELLSREDLKNLLFCHQVKNCPDYAQFIANNSVEALCVFSDEGPMRDELCALFLKFCRAQCEASHLNVYDLKNTYLQDLDCFNLHDEAEFIPTIYKEMQEVLDRQISYFDFRRKNPYLNILFLNLHEEVGMKEIFLKGLELWESLGLIQSLKKYEPECQIFKIEKDEIAEIILSKEIKHKLCSTLDEFQQRNGPSAAADLMTYHPETLPRLQALFFAGCSTGLLAALGTCNMERALLQITDKDLEAAILPKELEVALKNQSYPFFENRNGKDAYAMLLNLKDKDYRPDLQKLFLTLPYTLIRREDYHNILTHLDIQAEQIRDLIANDAMKMKFFDFFSFHGCEALEYVFNCLPDEKKVLHNKFIEYIQTCPIEDIEKLEKDQIIYGNYEINHCYRIRWESMTMRQILKSDFSVFFKKRQQFSAFFREKTVHEIQNLPIKEIVSIYKHCFGVCLDKYIMVKGTSIEALVEADIGGFEDYSDFEFRYHSLIDHLIAPGSKNVRKLANKHLTVNCMWFLEGNSDYYLESMKAKKFISEEDHAKFVEYQKEYAKITLEYNGELLDAEEIDKPALENKYKSELDLLKRHFCCTFMPPY